jgi:hypothetical protein
VPVIGISQPLVEKPQVRHTTISSTTNISESKKLPEIKASKEAKKILLETEINVSPSDTKTNVIKPPVSRPQISILPEDPKEKQKHVIKMALEQFSVLSLKYSNEYSDYFICSEICPVCNKDHKKENIKKYIEGEWGSGDYVNTKTYRLKCWGNEY